MAPKRKQASDNSIEAPSDAPRSKRKRTEATQKESAKVRHSCHLCCMVCLQVSTMPAVSCT